MGILARHVRVAPRSTAVTDSELFVGDSNTGAVLVFPRTGDGVLAPLRIITNNSVLGVSDQLAIVGNQLHVVSFGHSNVAVFALNAGNNATPVRVLRGPSTGLNHPSGIATF